MNFSKVCLCAICVMSIGGFSYAKAVSYSESHAYDVHSINKKIASDRDCINAYSGTIRAWTKEDQTKLKAENLASSKQITPWENLILPNRRVLQMGTFNHKFLVHGKMKSLITRVASVCEIPSGKDQIVPCNILFENDACTGKGIGTNVTRIIS